MTIPTNPQVVEQRKRFLLGALIGCEAIQYGEFTLKSGEKSDIYVDIRRAALLPRLLLLLRQSMTDMIDDVKFDSIGCDEGPAPTMILGAILGNWVESHPIPDLSRTHVFDPAGYVVRKEVKDHGTKKDFEGTIGNSPIFIEDVTTTGGIAKSAILKMPRKPIMVMSVVDRQQGAKDVFDSMGIPLRSIFTLDNIRNWNTTCLHLASAT